MIQFSCLTGIPPMTKGQVREIRVRWTLEELGLSYEEIRYPHPETKKHPYLDKQPFGQVPYFESDDICMFESGAILLHLAEKHQKLLPKDLNERAHTYQWMFAALNSVEPYIWHYFMLKFQQDSSEALLESAKKLVESKLAVVADYLGDRNFFGREFTITDIIMTSVLKTSNMLGLIESHKNLKEFVARLESRPACQRALNGHYKLYENNG